MSLVNGVKNKNHISIIIAIIAFLIVTWKAFLPGYSFALLMDNEFFIGAILSSMSESVLNGEWPFRMSTALGGLPLFNLTQLSPFYPFYFIFLSVFNSPLEAANSMHWLTLMHLLIFLINLVVLMRTIGTSPLAAALGAVLIAAGANSFSYSAWLNITAPYAWLPLYLAGLIGVLQEEKPIEKYLIISILSMIFLVFASPSQPLIHAVMLTMVVVLTKYIVDYFTGYKNAYGLQLKNLFFVAFISILIAAPVIFPAALDFGEMIRWLGPFGAIVGHQKIPFEAFLIDQLDYNDLMNLVVNRGNGAIGNPFIGPIVLCLVLVALTNLRDKTALRVSFIVLAFYSLASALGSNSGFAYINYNLPLINKIREPSRFIFLFQLAIGVLASLGLDDLSNLIKNNRNEKKIKIIFFMIASVLIATMAITLFLFYKNNTDKWVFISSSILLVLLGFVSISVIYYFRAWTPLLLSLMFGVASVIYLAVNVDWTPRPLSKSVYLNSDAVRLEAALNEIKGLDSDHQYRVIFEGEIDKQLAAMLASYENIRTLNSYFNPVPADQFQELYHHGPRTDNYLKALGVRYLLCKNCGPEQTLGFVYYKKINNYELYLARDAAPYIQVKSNVDGEYVGLNDFILKLDAIPTKNKGFLFIHESNAPIIEGFSKAPRDCLFNKNELSKNRVVISTSCESASIVTLNEFFSDSWRVYIDGVPETTVEVNGNQVGVAISAGSHLVEFQYLPKYFYIFLVASLIGFILLAHICFRYYRNKLFSKNK